MKFRLRDHYVPLTRAALAQLLPAASPKVALFVHGLGTTEWSFCLAAAAYRLWLGGDGVVIGLTTITLAVLLGLAFRAGVARGWLRPVPL